MFSYPSATRPILASRSVMIQSRGSISAAGSATQTAYQVHQLFLKGYLLSHFSHVAQVAQGFAGEVFDYSAFDPSVFLSFFFSA